MIDIRESLGLLTGLVTATMGAWKDTLFEPFEAVKFVRSPLLTEFWYLVLLNKYPDAPLSLLLLGAAALERVSVEGYKSIMRLPPGKFQMQGRDHGWLLDRLNIEGVYYA